MEQDKAVGAYDGSRIVARNISIKLSMSRRTRMLVLHERTPV